MSFSQQCTDSYRDQWDVVQKFCYRSEPSFHTSGGLIVQQLPDAFFNLPLILAFSLLDEVLSELAAQGLFSLSRRAMLGHKMRASRVVLPWCNYASVEAAKERRNDLAHEGVLIPRGDCIAIVELIGDELRAFGALPI